MTAATFFQMEAPLITPMDFTAPGICGMGLHFRLDGFRLIYVAVAVLMWAASGVFSREYMEHYEKKRRYYLYFWATFLATAGVFLSADLYTTFIFFEIMSLTSYVWVAFDERRESLRAAETYLAVAMIGGLVMLMGLFLLYDLLGTLEIDKLGALAGQVLSGQAVVCQLPAGLAESGQGGRNLVMEVGRGSSYRHGIFSTRASQLYAAGGMLLFGFGAKAGCFPLHIWLPKAHPEAPAPASALLSGILTKAGVFGIIVLSFVMFSADRAWGNLIAALGFLTMFLGALLAVFSVNLKRTLACSSISQIGFILVGIGIACLIKSSGGNNSLAVRGAFLHMVNHSLFKLVLFLCAGAVFMNLHQLDLNEIRGFGKNQPVLLICFLTAALGISGIPLGSGYISKTLLHESIVEYRELLGGPAVWRAAEWLFLITGGMTVAYMLKLFIALFMEGNLNPDRQRKFDAMAKKCMRPASAAALAVPTVLLAVLGITPHLTMERLADLGQGFFMGNRPVHVVSYFAFENLKGGLISVGIGILLYVFVVRGVTMTEADGNGTAKQYVDRWPSWLDLENLIYRPVIETALPGICGAVCAFADRYVVAVPVKIGLAVSSVACRALDQGADGIIRLARATTHRQQPEPKHRHDRNGLGHLLGELMDALYLFRQRRPGGRLKRTKRESAVPAMIRMEEQWKYTWKQVEESFSFGLLLFCIGLCLTLGYLLKAFFGV